MPGETINPWDHVTLVIGHDTVHIEACEGDPQAGEAMRLIAEWIVDELQNRTGTTVG